MTLTDHLPLEPNPGRTAPAGLSDLLNRLDVLAQRDRVTVGDVVTSFGAASFAPVMAVPALIIVSPLSGIPLLPTILGILIGITAAQLTLGRDHLRLPGPLMRRGVEGARLRGALRHVSGLADWLDRTARLRLSILVTQPADRLVAALCALCGFAMPFLEIFPFASSFLGLAVALFSTALLTRDGLFVMLGILQVGIAAAIIGTVSSAVQAAI